MPQTRVTSPEGETYLVNHPDGATEEDIFAYVKRTYGLSEEPPVELPEDPALSLSRPEDDPIPEGVDMYPDPGSSTSISLIHVVPRGPPSPTTLSSSPFNTALATAP